MCTVGSHLYSLIQKTEQSQRSDICLVGRRAQLDEYFTRVAGNHHQCECVHSFCSSLRTSNFLFFCCFSIFLTFSCLFTKIGWPIISQSQVCENHSWLVNWGINATSFTTEIKRCKWFLSINVLAFRTHIFYLYTTLTFANSIKKHW